MQILEQVKTLKSRVHHAVIGQEDVITKIMIGLLTDGNVLLEGLPGLAKTRVVKAFAANLACSLNRIQFTPDLLPADITGTEIYQPQGEEKFVFQPGPLFSNLVLADEINRAPAKVQSALLEAMEERTVSVAGKTYRMEPLFMVLATENPIEQEGTYPLPEAQLDRFLMKLQITYPLYQEELGIMRLVREGAGVADTPETPISQKVIFEARKQINAVKVQEAAEKYIVDIITATRYPDKFQKELKQWLSYGASPRGTIALDKCARATAWLDGRDYVTPDDIRFVVYDVLRHRIILSYAASADGLTADQVLEKIIANVSVT